MQSEVHAINEIPNDRVAIIRRQYDLLINHVPVSAQIWLWDVQSGLSAG
jgi:hypothetical protein